MKTQFQKIPFLVFLLFLFSDPSPRIYAAVPVYSEIITDCDSDKPGNNPVPGNHPPLSKNPTPGNLSTPGDHPVTGNNPAPSHDPAPINKLVPAFPLEARALRDGWDLESLDTARNSEYLTVTEKDVILALNMARTDPHRYAQLYISEIISTYRGKLRSCSNGRIVKTIEGDVPAVELYNELMRQDPRPRLIPVYWMHHIADYLASEQSITGNIGHITNDGNNLQFRIDSYGYWKKAIGETIDYGGMTGFDAINNLLIDDGISNRSHRHVMFVPLFHVVGVSIRHHPVYGAVTVVDYADSFKVKPKASLVKN